MDGSANPLRPVPTPDDEANRRREPRLELQGEVHLTLPADVVGEGTNVSSQGVLITLPEPVAVQVTLPGRDGPVSGELVRVQDLGNGRQGLAVRFLEPITQQG